MTSSQDKFDQVLAESVEREERVDWFERNMHRRRITPHDPEPSECQPAVYRVANAVLILLIALGLYLLGQFDGIRAERERIETDPQPRSAEFNDLVIRLPKGEGKP
jgi:hypothetical protein